MEYPKRANLLHTTLYQPSKFRTKNWIEINDESKVSHGTGSDMNFKTTTLRSNLCDYADAYIPVKGTAIITSGQLLGQEVVIQRLDDRNKGVILKTVVHLLIT